MKSLKNELAQKRFRVTIFGSARIKENDPLYKQIHDLAKFIAQEGIDIVTGGGPGLMDAASVGHYVGRKNKDLHTIGLTITLPREQRDSFHLDIKQNFEKFSHRLDHFMQLSNAVVVAPGGVGTALEFFYTWQLIQVKQTVDIPIILLGDMWKHLLQWVKKYPLKNGFLSKEDMHMLYTVSNVHEAIDIIKEAHKEFLNSDGKLSNADVYKVI